MAVQIALLRAVNVGGRSIPMADVRACVAALGMTEVQSLLQSGNLVFESPSAAGAELEALIEGALRENFGFDVDVIVRDGPEWAALAAANPFPEMAARDPGHLLAVPLKGEPSADDMASLAAAIVGREDVAVRGRELYVAYPDGIGTSKLTLAVIERTLKRRGTGRNWNTVLKLAAMAVV